MTQYLGQKWLAEKFQLEPVQAFAVVSKLGNSRLTVESNGTREETYIKVDAKPSLRSELTFALKHEIVNLEFFSRLFAVLDVSDLEQWLSEEPTGAYARRVGFLYEWLTDRQLHVPAGLGGNYVDALDSDTHLVAARSANIRRWRVRDNMPGTREFCPIIQRTEAIKQWEAYNCGAELMKLERKFGADILMRSVVWLSIKESRASFKIEHEDRHVDRVKRFAAVMDRRCGQDGDPLTFRSLNQLQADILGMATRYGLRKSPVIVVHTSGFTNVVDYIAPHWDHTEQMLEGLRTTMLRTKGMAPILRAAIASLGFVYIHPMSDGNGRISRFLVNDVLRRDKAVPAPFIIPISATIAGNSRERVAYDRALEVFSKPFMLKYHGHYDFGARKTYDDGIESDFIFADYEDALPAWRYPNLTQQTDFLGHVIRMTIEVEMSKEASYLRDIERARRNVKDHLEGPNSDIDQIIRSIRDNNWTLSKKLRKAFPMLENPRLAESIIEAVREALDPDYQLR